MPKLSPVAVPVVMKPVASVDIERTFYFATITVTASQFAALYFYGNTRWYFGRYSRGNVQQTYQISSGI